MNVLWTVLLCFLFAFIGYMFGNISNADIIADIKGVNLRQIGSNNPGATNSYRSLGAGYGFLIFFFDFLKGYIAVIVCYFIAMGTIFEWYPNTWAVRSLIYIGGICTVIGHCWTIKYLLALCKYKFKLKECKRFMGGKGVSTYCGVLFAFSPYIALICMFVFLVTYFICRYISIASTAFAGISSFLVFVPQLDLVYLTDNSSYVNHVTYSNGGVWFIIVSFIIFVLVSILIILRHIENYKRLVRHEEHKFYFRKSKQEKYELKRAEKWGQQSLAQPQQPVVDKPIEDLSKQSTKKVQEKELEPIEVLTRRVDVDHPDSNDSNNSNNSNQ